MPQWQAIGDVVTGGPATQVKLTTMQLTASSLPQYASTPGPLRAGVAATYPDPAQVNPEYAQAALALLPDSVSCPSQS